MAGKFMPHIAALLMATCAGPTLASDTYPSKPVKIVVPFTAGTATDTVTRIIAGALAKSLGQPVIVENRAGADGAIGAAEVARAIPDGYTLLMSTNGFCAVPSMRKNPPYHPIKDFSRISMVGRYSFFLYVNSSVPVRSLQELLDYGRAHPGKLNYATGNPTGIVATGQMLSLSKVNMLQVPYKGEPAGVTDLVANRVQLMFATPTTAGQYVAQGKLRMLATTLPIRSPAFPDIPTMEQAGVPKFSVSSWAALQGPANMPADRIERLSRAVAQVLGETEVAQQLARQNFLPASSTPPELEAFIKDQLAIYAQTLKEANVQPE
ncbi:tripartite tricarboxylate transporter substrate binding protein [Bordetella sp. BOR01]|uniref:Bug family tripartite tricarboxylate transporter substrate binding protein n=1 Tax=Bordetella sp. BOR01 TaxID=2854779 RepID=UPI001C461215|nr:tripartite tricarboxylate transporter substrate binding protein [Bordetella sp. BOR01]MBV7483857.1 tripartite tricarboxylate transporter substrate binding protein [Bordetella sp. BOR01]